jgi:5-methyltetrahydropteroyltriglutamate--homocysteine methyltransferase
MSKPIPTEPIGSIPRPKELQEGISRAQEGKIPAADLEKLFDAAVKDTLRRFEETGSPVITDGEQRKPSFATYPVHGLKNLAPKGVVIPFADGHTRQLPVLTSGPFLFASYAVADLKKAKALTKKPLKQAVISASALSLLYPGQGIAGYSRDEFLNDLVSEAVKDIRQCLDEGVTVQIDFTEGRLSMKLDPSKGLLKSFVDLNNRVLAAFSPAERERIGVHTCPGGDHDSTHSADVDYSSFLPELFQMNAGSFFVQLSSERDRKAALKTMKPFATGKRRIFIGVTDPISSKIETPDEICSRILEAVDFIPPSNLGTTDDCGFSPFCDDVSTSRDTAFAKIRARVLGTQMAAEKLRL